MRALIFLVTLVSWSCGGQELIGTLTLEGETIDIKERNGCVQRLTSGRYELQQKGKRLKIIGIEENTSKATLRLPNRRPFETEEGMFKISSEDIGQDFSIQGQRNQEIISTWQEDGTESCTYSGFCHACGIDFSGDYNCGFQFNPSCPGSRDVVRQMTEYDSWYEIDFIASPSEEYLGRFRSDTLRSITGRVIERLSSCG